MTIGSLFSGIGGLELGLEWAGLGPTVWQVERDPCCLRVLERHWPNAKRFRDVKEVSAHELTPVDLICGGFPCQDLSPAGPRTGLGGPRSSQWREFARIVAECRPRWAVVENVAGNARAWVDAIRYDLGQLGYASLPVPIAAVHVGAWHQRARVFIVAHRHDREPSEKNTTGHSGLGAESTCTPTADPDDANFAGQQRCGRETRELDLPAWNPWTAEPGVARVVHGLPGRVDRERMIGNAVVPQCAQVIGELIRILSEGR